MLKGAIAVVLLAWWRLSSCYVEMLCSELIAKIEKMKSQYSDDRRGFDDDDSDDEPNE